MSVSSTRHLLRSAHVGVTGNTSTSPASGLEDWTLSGLQSYKLWRVYCQHVKSVRALDSGDNLMVNLVTSPVYILKYICIVKWLIIISSLRNSSNVMMKYVSQRHFCIAVNFGSLNRWSLQNIWVKCEFGLMDFPWTCPQSLQYRWGLDIWM